MANVEKWSNVQVSIQSALAAADVVTAVSKATTGVITSTAHGVANGEYFKTTAEGMYQIDGRVFRVSGSTANTLEMEGENTLLYDTFTSGQIEVITFGINMTGATQVTGAGGDFDFTDVTTIHSNIRKQIPGLPSPATYTFTYLWDPADPALAALKLAADNQSQRAIRFTFATGKKVLFNGYVGASGLPQGSAQEPVTTTIVLTMFGRPTMYAS